MKIIDLESGDPRLTTDLLPVLLELRPHLSEELFLGILTEAHGQGLRFTAAYDADGACVGAAGWRVVVNTAAVRSLYVDDLVTAAAARSTGVGHALLAHLEQHALAAGCTALTLESGTQRTDAHRFYFRERMSVTAFGFEKPLG
ncbi:N-acetyltransferase GCN5 [Streptomyces nojiriensis]|uniref:N-acetyltransferase GCN5 n=1 Tax=Streptomyces nojiriensis TaxID=66374 RepID=A0ABQ3SJX9_9ACTN|nr:GNAT family N-acetyltransferase [Streptomyces nojiriensis]QTI50059.1 Aminoalkylphosphonate N-acetyltransferase [Streptomyces nojiriensis]GGS22530.1 N-acetyltransferase GCN5 [Streptomyces nojiriensis]GHI68458.1 N-acetyltransferase GCN5 [Streptomyces nojiriensis]